MNEFARYHQARKTGVDPAKVVVATKSTKYRLIETRTNTPLIEGAYSLCQWKKKMHRSQNPFSTYRIEPAN